ncbi:MAG TPA: hypothetical protein VF267_13690, partial [Gammaproteobacteria bacterium]
GRCLSEREPRRLMSNAPGGATGESNMSSPMCAVHTVKPAKIVFAPQTKRPGVRKNPAARAVETARCDSENEILLGHTAMVDPER